MNTLSKLIRSLAFLTPLALFLASCEKQEQLLQSESPDGQARLYVNAARYSSMDPYTVEIWVELKEQGIQTPKAETEVFLAEVDKDHVLFDWQGDQLCYLTFKEKDGSLRQFKLQFNGKELSLTEVR